ncbi:NmrA family NAD(P)-binding protein [Streptomyces varsoviensis]|uniref:NmrA family NAD(P)-binding protein n=1 Tax=Streptomyces varsoviensis TaxID=67373 RepID=UPI003F4CCF60
MRNAEQTAEQPAAKKSAAEKPTTEKPATKTLVIGGTGKTGRRVVERLAAQGREVRVGSRKGDRPFVWEDAGSWGAALEGVGSVYVTYFPDLAFPGAAEAVGEFSRFAVERGAGRLVLLSGRGEEGARVSEERMKESGADWTVVRGSWFNQNFSEGFFRDAVRAGELALPTGEAAEPFVDADDIADVVVAALTDARHVGRTYELSGPRLLTFGEVAAELSKATGRRIDYVPVTLDAYRAALAEHGVPVEFADLFSLITDGRNAHLVNGVEEALGRAPRDFSAYARDAAAAGAWA